MPCFVNAIILLELWQLDTFRIGLFTHGPCCWWHYSTNMKQKQTGSSHPSTPNHAHRFPPVNVVPSLCQAPPLLAQQVAASLQWLQKHQCLADGDITGGQENPQKITHIETCAPAPTSDCCPKYLPGPSLLVTAPVAASFRLALPSRMMKNWLLVGSRSCHTTWPALKLTCTHIGMFLTVSRMVSIAIKLSVLYPHANTCPCCDSHAVRWLPSTQSSTQLYHCKPMQYYWQQPARSNSCHTVPPLHLVGLCVVPPPSRKGS
jgi:hypothetical protein